jgi:hypothetical protein
MNPFILYKNICYTYFESSFEYFKFIGLISKFEDTYINILYYIKTTSFVSFEKNVRYTKLDNGFNYTLFQGSFLGTQKHHPTLKMDFSIILRPFTIPQKMCLSIDQTSHHSLKMYLSIKET